MGAKKKSGTSFNCLSPIRPQQQRPKETEEPRKKFDVGLKKTAREEKEAPATTATFDKPQLKKTEQIQREAAGPTRLEGTELRHVEKEHKSAFEVRNMVTM